MLVEVRAKSAAGLPGSSVFKSVDAASAFFEGGSVGYSVSSDDGRLDGLKLETHGWKVSALDVEHVRSSFFDDEARFPRGSAEFDHGLVMRDIPHEWHTEPDLHV